MWWGGGRAPVGRKSGRPGAALVKMLVITQICVNICTAFGVSAAAWSKSQKLIADQGAASGLALVRYSSSSRTTPEGPGSESIKTNDRRDCFSLARSLSLSCCSTAARSAVDLGA